MFDQFLGETGKHSSLKEHSWELCHGLHLRKRDAGGLYATSDMVEEFTVYSMEGVEVLCVRGVPAKPKLPS